MPPTKNIILKRPSPFQKSKRIQQAYERSLRGVAREVQRLISGYNPQDIFEAEKLKTALKKYADLIEPWAGTMAQRILGDINNQDARSWREHSKRMSLDLQKEIQNAPTGEALKELMHQNVTLIKSIPLEAAEDVHKIVIDNLVRSDRPASLIDKLMELDVKNKNRATLIARTEIARASSKLTEARSLHIGSESYIWRSSKDKFTRQSHKEMDGHEFRWDTMPTLSDGTKCHAGGIYNCRCYPEPIIPEWR